MESDAFVSASVANTAISVAAKQDSMEPVAAFVAAPAAAPAPSDHDAHPLSPASAGPHTWAMLHLMSLCLALRVKSADALEKFSTFINALGQLWVCKACHAHLLKDLETHSLTKAVAQGADVFQWTVDLHNRVNLRLKKPQISLEDAKRIWSRDFSTIHWSADGAAHVELQTPNKAVQKSDFDSCWTSIFAVAFAFPPQPTALQQKAARDYLNGFLEFFPLESFRSAAASEWLAHPHLLVHAEPIATSAAFVDEVKRVFELVGAAWARSVLNVQKTRIDASPYIQTFQNAAPCPSCSAEALYEPSFVLPQLGLQSAPQSSPQLGLQSAPQSSPQLGPKSDKARTQSIAKIQAHAQDFEKLRKTEIDAARAERDYWSKCLAALVFFIVLGVAVYYVRKWKRKPSAKVD